MKNFNLKWLVGVGVAVLVGGVLLTSQAFANQGFWQMVAEKVAATLAGKVETPVQYEEATQSTDQVLGAITSTDIPSNYLCVNNVCTFSMVQTFTDVSTTIVSIPDPFLVVTSTDPSDVILQTDGTVKYTGASTTIATVRLDITGAATTTFQVFCGPAASVAAAPSINLLSSTVIATSSLGVVENNLTAANGGLVDGGTVAKVMLGHKIPYFNCLVTSVSTTPSFTAAGNAFDGKATVIFQRTR